VRHSTSTRYAYNNRPRVGFNDNRLPASETIRGGNAKGSGHQIPTGVDGN